MGPFWHCAARKSWKKILLKTITWQIFVDVTSCKNSKNFTCGVFIKLEKPHFEPTFRPYLRKIPLESFFQKSSESILILHAALTLCKKQKRFMNGFFKTLKKLDFGSISGPSWPKNFKTKFFPKNNWSQF